MHVPEVVAASRGVEKPSDLHQRTGEANASIDQCNLATYVVCRNGGELGYGVPGREGRTLADMWFPEPAEMKEKAGGHFSSVPRTPGW